MDRTIGALPEIPEPGTPMTSEERRKLRRRIAAAMYDALQGVDERLAKAFRDVFPDGRAP